MAIEVRDAVTKQPVPGATVAAEFRTMFTKWQHAEPAKFDEPAESAMIPACVSGKDDNGAGAEPAKPGGGAAHGTALGHLEMECSPVTEESERTRLIADIMRLLREPALPEHARTAGMTLIGPIMRSFCARRGNPRLRSAKASWSCCNRGGNGWPTAG